MRKDAEYNLVNFATTSSEILIPLDQHMLYVVPTCHVPGTDHASAHMPVSEPWQVCTVLHHVMS